MPTSRLFGVVLLPFEHVLLFLELNSFQLSVYVNQHFFSLILAVALKVINAIVPLEASVAGLNKMVKERVAHCAVLHISEVHEGILLPLLTQLALVDLAAQPVTRLHARRAGAAEGGGDGLAGSVLVARAHRRSLGPERNLSHEVLHGSTLDTGRLEGALVRLTQAISSLP